MSMTPAEQAAWDAFRATHDESESNKLDTFLAGMRAAEERLTPTGGPPGREMSEDLYREGDNLAMKTSLEHARFELAQRDAQIAALRVVVERWNTLFARLISANVGSAYGRDLQLGKDSGWRCESRLFAIRDDERWSTPEDARLHVMAKIIDHLEATKDREYCHHVDKARIAKLVITPEQARSAGLEVEHGIA